MWVGCCIYIKFLWRTLLSDHGDDTPKVGYIKVAVGEGRDQAPRLACLAHANERQFQAKIFDSFMSLICLVGMRRILSVLWKFCFGLVSNRKRDSTCIKRENDCPLLDINYYWHDMPD